MTGDITVIVMGANVVALVSFVFMVGQVWQRFKDVERRANRIPNLELMIGRIADRLGVKLERNEPQEESRMD